MAKNKLAVGDRVDTVAQLKALPEGSVIYSANEEETYMRTAHGWAGSWNGGHYAHKEIYLSEYVPDNHPTVRYIHTRD